MTTVNEIRVVVNRDGDATVDFSYWHLENYVSQLAIMLQYRENGHQEGAAVVISSGNLLKNEGSQIQKIEGQKKGPGKETGCELFLCVIHRA